MQGPGKAMQVPMLHAFCQRIGDLSAVPLSATPSEASEEARCMLTAFGAVGMKYQDVRASPGRQHPLLPLLPPALLLHRPSPLSSRHPI